MRHILVIAALSAALGSCASLREGLGKAEQLIAANDKGQLIRANAPTEGQPADAATTSPILGSTVADIGKASRTLPGGLIGDTANQIYIGDPVPPR